MKTKVPATTALFSTMLTLASAQDLKPAQPPAPPEPPVKVKILPQPSQDTRAVIHIQKDGKDIIRHVNVGNASEIRLDGGRIFTSAASSAVAATQGPDKIAQPVTWLGVTSDEVSEEVRAQLPLPAGTGLLVRSVVPDSPAAKAGLQKNDVLIRLDDQILVNSSQLRTLVSTRKDGDAVKLALLRQGKEVVSEAKLGTRNGGDDAWDLAAVITGGNPQDNVWASTAFVKPFVLQSRALVVDPEGNVVHVPAPTLPVEELTRLQDDLKKAGVSGDVSKEVERTLADVRRQLEESKTQLDQNKSKTLKRLEESAEELAGALQRAKEAMERTKAEAQGKIRKMEQLRKAVPAPAAAPGPDVPAIPPAAPSAPVPPSEPGAL